MPRRVGKVGEDVVPGKERKRSGAMVRVETDKWNQTRMALGFS